MTLDAMGCQHKIAQEIIKKKADYLLAVKGNQGKLADAFDNWYSPAMWMGKLYDSYSTQEKAHGREETRFCIVSHDLTPLGDLAYDWPELSNQDIFHRGENQSGKKEQSKNNKYNSKRDGTNFSGFIHFFLPPVPTFDLLLSSYQVSNEYPLIK